MIHNVFAPGMHNRAYFHRYTDDNVDLCDILSSFSYGAKVKLDEPSRIMGLPGKPDGIDGSQVKAYFNAGRIQEIADYCKSDVINTYRLWLRHELFRGRLDQSISVLTCRRPILHPCKASRPRNIREPAKGYSRCSRSGGHAASRAAAPGVSLRRFAYVAMPAGFAGVQDRPPACEDANEADGDRGALSPSAHHQARARPQDLSVSACLLYTSDAAD